MDDSGAQLGRQDSGPGDDEVGPVDGGFGLLEAHARQGDKNQNLALGLQNVDRRFPGARTPGLKELAMQTLGPQQLVAGFRPHPIEISVHGKPHTALPKCVTGQSRNQ